MVALGYIVIGSEIPAAAAAPDCARIAIINHFKTAYKKCVGNPPPSDPHCKIYDEEIKRKIQPKKTKK